MIPWVVVKAHINLVNRYSTERTSRKSYFSIALQNKCIFPF